MASMAQGVARSSSSVGKEQQQQQKVMRGQEKVVSLFSISRNKSMPVTRPEFEGVPEWKLNCLLSEHGLPAPIKGQLLGGCF